MQILQSLTGWLRLQFSLTLAMQALALALSLTALAALGGNLFYSNGRWFAFSCGVRPVVYLESNITVEDLHKIDGQEEDWSADSNEINVAHGNSSNGEAGNYGTPGGLEPN